MSADLPVELQALTHGCALMPPSVMVIEVRGRDAREYLQRSVSADLRSVTGGHGALCAVLTGKGRLVASFEVLEGPAGILLVIEEDHAERLVEHLERLVILEDVLFERGASWRCLSIQGPDAERVLRAACTACGASLAPDASLPQPLEGVACFELAGADARVAWRPRSVAGGWDLMVPTTVHAAVRAAVEAAGAVPVSTAVAEWARIQAGIPRLGMDATPGDLPPEVGLAPAIAMAKGCYAGQEVMARIRTYGHVNRRLCRLRFASEVSTEVVPDPGTGGSTGATSTAWPAPGTELFPAAPDAGDPRPVGHITSSAPPLAGTRTALALVRREVLESGACVAVQGVIAQVEPLHPRYAH